MTPACISAYGPRAKTLRFALGTRGILPSSKPWVTPSFADKQNVMKRNLTKVAVFTTALVIGELSGSCQSFVNLNFESPIPPLTPDPFFQVPITNALPGWTGYLGGTQTDRVSYNTVSLGAAAISLHDQGSSRQPVQGNYSVILQPSEPFLQDSAAVGQTGQIPS